MGAALTLVGTVILAALVYVFNCGDEACERAMITLGLALSAALASLGQIAVIAGLWLLWTSRRPAP